MDSTRTCRRTKLRRTLTVLLLKDVMFRPVANIIELKNYIQTKPKGRAMTHEVNWEPKERIQVRICLDYHLVYLIKNYNNYNSDVK